jgi:hypothetical protein
MAEENRTPDKKIGEIQHAEEQTKRKLVIYRRTGRALLTRKKM